MLTLGITIIEHNDLFVGVNCNDEYHLYKFQFKTTDAKFVSSKNLLENSVTTTLRHALNSHTRQTDKHPISEYLNVDFPSELKTIIINYKFINMFS